MNLEIEEAQTFFGILFGGQHHIPGKIKEYGIGWSVNYRGDFATFDFDQLTRLVVLAHEMCIRACIMQGGPGAIKIAIHKRKREGSMYERHPTLVENIERIKSWRWPAAEIDRLQSIEPQPEGKGKEVPGE